MRRQLTITLALVTVIAGLFHPPAAHAHMQMFDVRVNRYGFEGTVDYSFMVEEGHPVTITFNYADGDLADDNAHEIRITGAGVSDLPTVTISRDHPTETITFTPQRSGLLRIVCIVPCVGMENLTGGQIKVVRPHATGAPTSLALELSPRTDGDVLARATLTNANGEPIANAPVTFILHTSLGGDLALDTPTTMEDGSVVVRIPAAGIETLRITASYEGGGGLAYTESSGEISVPGALMEHQPGSLSAPVSPPALALALLVVLGGVWATYGLVMYQLIRIRRES